MLIKKPEDIKSSEITDEKLYWSRRTFIRGATLATTAAATGWLYRKLATPNQQAPNPEIAQAASPGEYLTPGGEKATGFEDIWETLSWIVADENGLAFTVKRRRKSHHRAPAGG